MRVRYLIIGLAIAAGLGVAPARAGDFDKYVPDGGRFYVHVNVPKLFGSEMVRKAVPMALDKYGDNLAGLIGMAKQFNPNMPDVPEDQVKQGIKEASNPENIAKAFDAAQNIVSDLVVTGSSEGESPNMVILVKSAFITAEGADIFAAMAGAQPQMKIEKVKHAKGTIFVMTVPQAPVKMYVTVPEVGVLHIAMSQAGAESSFAAKGKPGDKLSTLMGKKQANDFVFVAALGEEAGQFTGMSGNLVLDKDLTGNMVVDFKDEKKAAEHATEVNEKLTEMVEQMKGMLGDKAAVLKPHVEKTKAKANGKTVTGSLSIPGSVVETLLKKD